MNLQCRNEEVLLDFRLEAIHKRKGNTEYFQSLLLCDLIKFPHLSC